MQVILLDKVANPGSWVIRLTLKLRSSFGSTG